MCVCVCVCVCVNPHIRSCIIQLYIKIYTHTRHPIHSQQAIQQMLSPSGDNSKQVRAPMNEETNSDCTHTHTRERERERERERTLLAPYWQQQCFSAEQGRQQ